MSFFSRKKKASQQSGFEDIAPPPTTEATQESFPDGIEILHNPSDAIVDVCFVHGLTGNRRSTWTADKQSSPWPSSLLATRLDGARLMTWGYDAYVVRTGVAGKNSLAEHASNLVADLADDRTDHPTRPLILVAHSLGGLVCKRALLAARNSAEGHLRDIFRSAKGIIFLGTPHQGSWMADWSKIPAQILGIVKSTNKSLLQILQTDDKFLRAIQDDFLNMLRGLPEQEQREIKVICFYEELPMPGVGVVVSQDSATFAGYQLRSIHANHSDMIKFASPEHTGFKRVLAELKRWTNECSGPIQTERSEAGIQKAINDKLFAMVETPALYERAREYLGVTSEEFNDTIMRKLIAAWEAEQVICSLIRHENTLRFLSGLDAKRLGCIDPSRITELRQFSEAFQRELQRSVTSVEERCLQSLAYEGMSIREASIERPLHNTCTWIYQNETYNRWRSMQNGLLWIKGKPGSGKSVLMKSLSAARKLEGENDTSQSTNGIVVEFYFNARGSVLERSPAGLYSSLIYSLACEDKSSRLRFLEHFLRKEARTPSRLTWTWLELAEIFHKKLILQLKAAICIFVDALDECDDDIVRQVVTMFEETLEQASFEGRSVQVCWSSRYYPNISTTMDFSQDLRLDQHNRWDIDEFVARRLGAIAHPHISQLRQDVLTKSDGVFLWVVLAIRRLHKAFDDGASIDELKGILKKLPKELDDLFDQIFDQMRRSDNSQAEFRRFASWLLCSHRPLTAEELYTMQSVYNRNGPYLIDPGEFSQDAFWTFVKRINALSCGLFEVVRSSKGRTIANHAYHNELLGKPRWAMFNDDWTFDSYSNYADAGRPLRVQVIHESVREYLLGSKGMRQLGTPSSMDFIAQGVQLISETCLRGLLATNFWPVDTVPEWDGELDVDDVINSMGLPKPPSSLELAFVQSFLSTYIVDHMGTLLPHNGTIQGHQEVAWSPQKQRLAFRNVVQAYLIANTNRTPLQARYSVPTDRLFAHDKCFSYELHEINKLTRALHYFNATLDLLYHMGIQRTRAADSSQPPEFESSFLAVFGLCTELAEQQNQPQNYGRYLAGAEERPRDDAQLEVHCVARFNATKRKFLDVADRGRWKGQADPTLMKLRIMQPNQPAWSSELQQRWNQLPRKTWSDSMEHDGLGLCRFWLVYTTANSIDDRAQVSSLVCRRYIRRSSGHGSSSWWQNWIDSRMDDTDGNKDADDTDEEDITEENADGKRRDEEDTDEEDTDEEYISGEDTDELDIDEDEEESGGWVSESDLD